MKLLQPEPLMQAIDQVLMASQSANDALNLPDELAECAARHQQNLNKLIASFRAVGLDDMTIEDHVRKLVSSYQVELLAALREMLKR